MYAEMAPVYRAAGWLGTLPLPPGQKYPPPANFTGWHSPDPSDQRIEIWRESAPTGNIGLRMPESVVGLDVDDYGSKHGLQTMALAEERWGSLPATWMSTAREGGSGIRFYRVPEGTRFPGKLELDGISDVEIIQRGHRFAVVYPSIHPVGTRYLWHSPGGTAWDIGAESVPMVDDLPELPESWITGIQSTGKSFGQGPEKRKISNKDALDTLLAFHGALEEPCSALRERTDAAIERLDQPGARHDSALSDSLAIAGLGRNGHIGVVTALEDYKREFISRVSVDRDDADAEFERMLIGAIALLDGELLKTDPCEVEDEKFERDVADKVYRLRVNEEAQTQHHNLLAGELRVPEFDSAWQVAQTVPEEREWLLENLIPRRGVVSLSAAKKTGKSTVIHKIIESMLNGTAFLDRFIGQMPRGNIHLIDMELDKATLGPWLVRNGIARRENVFVSSLYGRATDLNIFNKKHRGAIADTLQEQNCKMLVVDPVGPYLRMLGADESDSTEAGRAIDALIALKELAKVDTLLLTMHAGHASKNRARGSSVLLDTPDVNLNMFKKSEDATERHFSGEGRDVDIDLITFTYDKATGQITVLDDEGVTDGAREDDILAVLTVLERAPGANQGRIIEGLKVELGTCGKSRGRSAIERAIAAKFVHREKTADSPKAPINHCLTEHGQAELAQVRRVRGEAA